MAYDLSVHTLPRMLRVVSFRHVQRADVACYVAELQRKVKLVLVPNGEQGSISSPKSLYQFSGLFVREWLSNGHLTAPEISTHE